MPLWPSLLYMSSSRTTEIQPKSTGRKPNVIINDCLIFKSREPPFILLDADTSQLEQVYFCNLKKNFQLLLKLNSGSGTGVILGSIFKRYV